MRAFVVHHTCPQDIARQTQRSYSLGLQQATVLLFSLLWIDRLSNAKLFQKLFSISALSSPSDEFIPIITTVVMVIRRNPMVIVFDEFGWLDSGLY